MGFWTGLESNLEKYIEGFFKVKFKGVLQPIDVAKALTREMKDQRRSSLQEIYVPNRYEVYISPQDMDSLALILEGLAQELAQMMVQQAKEKQYTLLGLVQINWHQDRQISTGQLNITSFFDETVTEGAGGPGAPEETLKFNFKQLGLMDSLPNTTTSRAILTVTQGSLRGSRFIIGGNSALIGRRQICDVCLPDHSVSRRHAAITRGGEGYLIKDQASTNGTYVNGVKINQTRLKPGDEVKVGGVVLGFEVE